MEERDFFLFMTKLHFQLHCHRTDGPINWLFMGGFIYLLNNDAHLLKCTRVMEIGRSWSFNHCSIIKSHRNAPDGDCSARWKSRYWKYIFHLPCDNTNFTTNQCELGIEKVFRFKNATGFIMVREMVTISIIKVEIPSLSRGTLRWFQIMSMLLSAFVILNQETAEKNKKLEMMTYNKLNETTREWA